MLRISIFIIGLLLIIYSCNNDISSIGQELINNDNYIGEDNLAVNTLGTIRIDSFMTSTGFRPSGYTGYISKLVMGRYDDPIYSGTTTAIPCFQVIPVVPSSIPTTAVLDSLTLRFRYAGNMWGDTLYQLEAQTFRLFQLKTLPSFDYNDQGLFYNTTPIDLGDEISTTTFYPLTENMKLSYFKIDQELAEDLFDRMVYRREDDIYMPTIGDFPYINFLNYFHGLAIVPDEQNNCLMSIHALSDSLYLQFHYTVNNTQKSIKFPLGQREYQFNQILTKPAPIFSELQNQRDEVSFDQTEVSIIQGLAGYMIKMNLPQPPGYPKYSTIIRAELELKPEIYEGIPIALPQTINVYTTNELNEFTGVLYDANNKAVTGNLRINSTNISESKYIFDLTEYYQKLSSQPGLVKDPQILLSVPNDGLTSSGVSFDRMVLPEKPTIKIYYANYK